MRSRCRRSIITTSTPASAASRSRHDRAAVQLVRRRAAAPPGAQTRISPAPSVRSACRSVRATREWRMSPTIGEAQLREIAALVPAHGEHVEQALGRVRGAAVAGVDEGGARARAGGERGDRVVVGMAHHEAVHAHRLEVAHGVERGLALAGGRGADVEVERVRAQARGGQLEGAARARGRLEEQRAHGAAGQARGAAPVAAGDVRRRSASAASSSCISVGAGTPLSVSRWRRRPSGRSCSTGCGRVHSAASSGSGMRDSRFGEPALEDDHRGERVELRGLVALARAGWRGRRRSAARPRSSWCARRPAAPAAGSARRSPAAKPRARLRIGWSPPSSVAGSPTTSASGATRGSSGRAPASRGRRACTSSTPTSRALLETVLPTATPMRRAPTSKPSSVVACAHGVADAVGRAGAMSTPMRRAAASQRSSSGVSKQIALSAGTVSQAFCASSYSSWPAVQPA